MKPQHYAGIITGVIAKDGLIQVLCTCKLGPDDAPSLSLQLPVPPPERGEWANAIGEKMVLSLALVDAHDKPGIVVPLPKQCTKDPSSPCMSPSACHAAQACQSKLDS